ncbi:hypothetical protein G7046_g8464 [Stylonectria norvegica]|nr:hypothetical protein G7046_g8464 [Stylonectria norvegica]
MVLRKHELEGKLGEEMRLIESGELKDENPLDNSPEFNEFLTACRRGDLRMCQELIGKGVNINGKDHFDYTPLIIVRVLPLGFLDFTRGPELTGFAGYNTYIYLYKITTETNPPPPGALAERNTFQGERCIYNALNDRIRNLLLQYDFSKSSDPFVYWSSHISTLLNRASPATSDITLLAGSRSFELHKFLLSSRSPYFREKLAAAPETTTWKLASTIPVEALQIVLRYIYLGDVPRDLVPPGSAISEEDVVKGLGKISKQLEVEQLWEAILAGTDRRLARQRYEDEVARALKQVSDFFERNVLGHKMVVDTDLVKEVKWNHDNAIFADVLLRADEPIEDEDEDETEEPQTEEISTLPIGPAASSAKDPVKKRKSVLYPAHKAMLIRSTYFEKMFSGDFVEAQKTTHLRTITVDCTPAVLEIILTFLYTEAANCPLEHALDVLYTADMLFLDSLKSKAAVAISTLGSGTANVLVDRTHGDDGGLVEMEPINIYDVLHAAWDLRVRRLEEFAARYLAYRLEDYIDDDDFAELIAESAQRIRQRQETDTIELLDDIRYYLSERFRLRFEEVGLGEMMGDDGEIEAKRAAELFEMKLSLGDDMTVDAGEKTEEPRREGVMMTLDGEEVDDEFESDALNYQLLLEKIDAMLLRLKLDA